jgi:hypothetical protein
MLDLLVNSLCWLFGPLCGLLALLQFVAGMWFLIELRRKWRSVPEFWSVDWLHIIHHLKQAFGVTLTSRDFETMPAEVRGTLTAGQLWEVVVSKLMAAGHAVPADGWERAVGAISEALNVKPRRIAPDSRLYMDLGMAYGLD